MIEHTRKKNRNDSIHTKYPRDRRQFNNYSKSERWIVGYVSPPGVHCISSDGEVRRGT